MMAVNSVVLLYKDLRGDGFNLLSEEWTHTEEKLSFVHLKDVSFDIYEDKRKVAITQGIHTVHAVARGTLINALPKNLSPAKDLIKKIKDLPEIDYKPNPSAFFYFVNNGKEIHSAKNLYALDGKVRVEE